jgi:hypothetical protein
VAMADEAIVRLRKLLRDLFTARYQGVDGMRASRAQGYVDGYMAALLASGKLSQREMLAIVAEERARAAGPSTQRVAIGEPVAA